MHHKHITAALAAALATVVLGDAGSDVHELTKDSFSKFLAAHPIALVEFFAPWCGHCKALAPEYEEAATTLKEKGIPLAKVDCTVETEICKEQGVEGYPTLKVMRGPDDVKPYAGPRKAEPIVSYMIKQSMPAVSHLTKETHNDFKTADHVAVIAYVAEGDKTSLEVFENVGGDLRDKFFFGVVQDASIAKAEGIEMPSIVLYKDFDEGKNTFVDKFEPEAIMGFIQTSATPLVGAIGPDTYNAYVNTKLPLCYIFAETEEERKELAELLKPLAVKYKGVLNIATIDATAYGGHAANINLKTDKFPAFAIQDIVKNLKYPFPQDEVITFKAISEQLEKFTKGILEPSIKSEPVPETQDGPVTVVVGKTFKEIVLENTDADVLVEFYAPWCGHCKALAPKYDALGRAYKEAGHGKKVVIAKIDATANDVPADIKGFPTLYYYTANDKENPEEYQGNRSLEDLVKFIGEKGHNKVVIDVPEEPVPEEKKEEKKAEEKKEEEKKEEKEEKEEAEEEEEQGSHDEL